jgi:hypothetical protein
MKETNLWQDLVVEQTFQQTIYEMFVLTDEIPTGCVHLLCNDYVD